MTEPLSDRDAVILKMRRASIGTRRIAAAIGATRGAVERALRRLAETHEFPASARRRFWSDDDTAAAKKMMEAGATQKEVSERLGFSTAVVSSKMSGFIVKPAGCRSDRSIKGVNDGFLADLEAAGYAKGAGEMADVPREPIGRFYPQPRASGVGSPQQLCAEN